MISTCPTQVAAAGGAIHQHRRWADTVVTSFGDLRVGKLIAPGVVIFCCCSYRFSIRDAIASTFVPSYGLEGL